MATMTDCGVAPATQGWRLRGYWTALRAGAREKARVRADLARLRTLPDYLRDDVGLDGGLPLAEFQNGGRVFVSHGLIDRTLSDWHW